MISKTLLRTSSSLLESVLGLLASLPEVVLRLLSPASGRPASCSSPSPGTCNEDRLRRAISNVLEGPPRILVMDLSALRFTDCAGLSVLAWAHKRLAEHGHELVITSGQPLIRRLLCLTGLDTYLHLSDSEA
jgi:anti-anti-sigma factor